MLIKDSFFCNYQQDLTHLNFQLKDEKEEKKKEEEKKPPKPVTVREPLEMDSEALDIPHVTDASVAASKKK